MKRKAEIKGGIVYCRCCDRVVLFNDGYPIHTACIPKHWGKHSKGVNAARCHEFGKRKA